MNRSIRRGLLAGLLALAMWPVVAGGTAQSAELSEPVEIPTPIICVGAPPDPVICIPPW